MLYHTPVARFEKKSMKMYFKKKYQILENQSMFPKYSYYRADWFLNLFGFRVLIPRLPRVQQVIIRDFMEEIADLNVK